MIGMRGMGVLLCVVVCMQTALSQSYPRWFLEQGSLRCGLSAVGYSNKGFYEDSSVSQAARNARQNLARQRMTVVAGSQAFWTTEAGTAWMGGDLKVSVDSAALRAAATDTGRAEAFTCDDMIISLVTMSGCDLPDSMKEVIGMPAKEPSWVRGARNSSSRIYSMGVAPRYFYESSSWEAAEHMALLELAREGGDSVIAMQKNIPGSGQQVLNEYVSVTLRSFGIVARWIDARDQVFYVLMAADRRNIMEKPDQ
jgi:hypothetical protein